MILLRPIEVLWYMFFLYSFERIGAVIYSGSKIPGNGYQIQELDRMIQKVSLTQKGYIQFLKYTTSVPTLTDYTFCVWVRSNNLTFNHPLLSYSKHEDERLIRVWISEKGYNLCLEILNHPIFKVQVNLLENVWYHVCQSWSAQSGAWELYINGKLKSSGFVPKLRGVPIEDGGDIVVGQEYTDFDKGLDDGIEGDVFGFNFVLSSTTSPTKLPNHPTRRHFDAMKSSLQSYAVKPLNIYQPLEFNAREENRLISVASDPSTRKPFSRRGSSAEAPGVTARFSKGRFPRNIFQDMMNLFDAEVQASYIPLPNRFYTKIPVHNQDLSGRRISNEITFDSSKSLGLLLIELSSDCSFRKGAPLSGSGVLISWTKSPVRVFGGAIIKKVQPFCRTFNS